MWTGPVPSVAELKVIYGFKHVILTSALKGLVEQFDASSGKKIYTMKESLPAEFASIVTPKGDLELVLEVVGELRQTKSEIELEYLQFACDVNSKAIQKALKKAVRPGKFAYQVVGTLEKVWDSYDCLERSFAPLVLIGPKAAVLHGADLRGELTDGSLVLIDVGCEYFGYAADNTRTVPVNGKFSADQAGVYQAVLDAHKAVIAAAKPGVWWPDLAQLSAEVMAAGLIKTGLLRGTVREVVDSGALAAFYPHGLGHGMGLDVHEICGWPKGSVRPPEFHKAAVRFGRKLEEGVVITDEPGCYFLPELFGTAKAKPEAAKHINFEVAERFAKTVGGIRIEDDLLITAAGCRNLSKIPKELSELEEFLSTRKKK
jgi:Xaa-Pro dipeptidase